jgi:hypothetical protein
MSVPSHPNTPPEGERHKPAAYTRSMLDPHTIQCPYCGEHIEILVDASAGDEQSYIEDCQVCCSPISIGVHIDADGDARVSVAGQNDA